MLFGWLMLIIALKVHVDRDEPLIPSLIVVIPSVIIDLLIGGSISVIVIGAPILFVIMFIYFWLLTKFSGSFLYYVVMILGLLGMFVPPFLG